MNRCVHQHCVLALPLLLVAVLAPTLVSVSVLQSVSLAWSPVAVAVMLQPVPPPVWVRAME